jgi:hypothetical protein
MWSLELESASSLSWPGKTPSAHFLSLTKTHAIKSAYTSPSLLYLYRPKSEHALVPLTRAYGLGTELDLEVISKKLQFNFLGPSAMNRVMRTCIAVSSTLYSRRICHAMPIALERLREDSSRRIWLRYLGLIWLGSNNLQCIFRSLNASFQCWKLKLERSSMLKFPCIYIICWASHGH